MKKLILLLSIIALFFQSSFAQTGGLNFQGVARNATGAVLANQKINLKFSILKTTETGTVEYTETKEATTNAQGIFAVVVGEVNATSFATVDWKVTPKFLKVEMDAAGGTSFITMGTTRLQNVPFAYYANGVNANNIDGTVPVSKGGTGAINAAGARSNIGAESLANKSTDLVADATSTIKYPSVKTIKDYVDTKVASGNISGTTIAITNGGTGATTAAAALTNLGAESTANKSTDITLDASSLTKYPSVKSIKDYVDTRVITGVSTSTDLNITSVNGLELGLGGVLGGGKFDSNVGIGKISLINNTTGIQNTSIGKNALMRNDTGDDNTAIGYLALEMNSGGRKNTAIGSLSLSGNAGQWNTAVGYKSLYRNGAGMQNTAIGESSMSNNNGGWANTAVGSSSLMNNSSGAFNTAIGVGALINNLTGIKNTAIGNGSLGRNTNGSRNVALGENSGYQNLSGSYNTLIGDSTDVSSTNLTNSTALGNGAIVSASNTIQLGNTAITDVKTSGTLTASGYKTPSGTSSQYLMADGSVSAGGISGTSSNISRVNGLSLGIGSGYNVSNIAIGEDGLNRNTNGFDNISIGWRALNSNTSGNMNVAVGSYSMENNLMGAANIAIGNQALRYNTTGDTNVAIGLLALSDNYTGISNTAIGTVAGLSFRNGNNNTFIGFESSSSSLNVSNTINLGNSSITTLRAQVTSITSLSDKRDKTDIVNISEGLDFLKQLRPVSFTWNTRDKAKVGIKSAGFIAQELLTLQKNSTIGDNLDLVSQDNPEKLEARYNNLLPVIVKAIQEVSNEKDKEIAELKARIQSLEEMVNKVLETKKP